MGYYLAFGLLNMPVTLAVLIKEGTLWAFGPLLPQDKNMELQPIDFLTTKNDDTNFTGKFHKDYKFVN